MLAFSAVGLLVARPALAQQPTDPPPPEAESPTEPVEPSPAEPLAAPGEPDAKGTDAPPAAGDSPADPEKEPLVVAGEADADAAAEPVPLVAAAADADGSFHDSFVLDTGRITVPTVVDGDVTFSLHGELQLRHRAFRDLDLTPPLSDPSVTSLGQRHYLYAWTRFRPVFQYADVFKVVGEIDVPRGMVLGETTQWATAARDSLAELKWYEVHPRQLYLEYLSPIGLFRLGQQTSHWGMGIVASDGDHPQLFGDYRRGALVERLLFATKPMGRDEPLQVAIGGDLVFEDARAKLVDGDRALQLIGAIRWQDKNWELGVYGVLRHQESDRESTGALTPFTETLDVGVVDLAGKFNAPIPGVPAYVFGQFEAAVIAGNTNYVRNIDQLRDEEKETVRNFGGAAVLGVVRTAGSGADRWGDVVVSLEWGYASGDADPGDGVTKRFSFDQNHNVGLVLFDQVLAWKTARAATIAQDPQIVNRPSPGLQLLPSEGSVYGATYLNPTVVVRPERWVDVKAGVVLAESTADVVDPFHYGALGNYANWDGGDETRHDLGVEFDLGADFRVALDPHVSLQFGTEGGLLVPGGAFVDAAGNRLPLQYLMNNKIGVQF